MKSIKQYIRTEIENYLRENNIKFKRKTSLEETESAANAADQVQISKLTAQKADKEKQKAGVDGEIAKIKGQIDAIEKK